MSRIVDTKIGRFRQVDDGGERRFLYECPVCREWLPIRESHLQGAEPIDHLAPLESGAVFQRPCAFQGYKALGDELLAALRARILFGERPYTDAED